MEQHLEDENVWECETNPEGESEWIEEFWSRIEEADKWEREKSQERQKTLLSPPKNFSSEFLSKYHDLVLYDVFHQIKALMLFPLNCACREFCECSEWREKVVLALNTHLYNQAQVFEKPDRIFAMKALLRIPEDHAFRALYAEAYPIWLIDKELKSRENNNHFKIVDQLVWTFLRVGNATKSNSGAQKVSLNTAMKIIIGDTPLKAKASTLKNETHLCGEKEYANNFNKYKFVFHFIAALEVCKKEIPNWEYMVMGIYPDTGYIEKFLSIAHWFREKLLCLERDNVKGNVFLSEESICPLPRWVQSDNIDFPLDLSEEDLRKIKT